MQNNAELILNDVRLKLHRYPKNQHDKSLQAWDSADEYIIEHLKGQDLVNKTLLVLNDNFGALSCYFASQNSDVYFSTDSWLSTLGLKQNLELNNLPDQSVNCLNSLENFPQDIDIVIIKIPRSLAFLEYQLFQLSQVLKSTTLIVSGAKSKDIHNSTLSLFEKYLGETTTSLAKKKSRLIFSTFKSPHCNAPEPSKWQLSIDRHCFNISNLANVFSRNSLDIGARFYLDYLPEYLSEKHVIDLGCGNGVLGLAVLVKSTSVNVTFVDESFMAVETARQNVRQNLPEALESCEFKVDDCLSEFEANSVDCILCNPPFHQQNTITEHIAKQMFKDAKRVLKPGGEFRIVANSHLPYPAIFKRLFGQYRKIASNEKFVILSAFK